MRLERGQPPSVSKPCAERIPDVTLTGKKWLVIAALIALCAVEFLLFDRFGSHRVTGIYPRWNDQIQYLSEAYVGYEDSQAHGLLTALGHTLINPSAQGTLHDFAAVVAFTVAGASRSTALALNMLALIAWQLALFGAIRRTTGRTDLAWLAALLPIVLRGPWLIYPGSANDFRLDHFAMCALGVTSACAMLTRRFTHRGWTAAFGFCTAVTMLTRFITGTYFVVIFTILLLAALFAQNRWRRVANLLLAGGIVVLVAGPIFWLNREWVWNYYYIGHYVGPESAIRNQNFGLLKSTAFVWGRLFTLHLGWFFAIFGGVLTAALAGTRVKPANRASDASPDGGAITAAVVGLIFLLAPALPLTLHPQKSEVVLSALAPGIILLVVALWAWASERGVQSGGLGRRVVVVTATIAAVGYFGMSQMRHEENAQLVADRRQINDIADYIVAHARAAKLDRPKIAVDHITDALDAQVIRVVCYERQHIWIDFDMRLPTGIAAPDANVVRQRMRESDFVFLLADDGLLNDYPYDHKLREMRPELRAWCDAHLKATRHLTLGSHPITLYQRPAIE